MRARTVLEFLVPGKPVQQGSKTVFMVKGRPVLADANAARLKPWRKLVQAYAQEHWAMADTLEGPVAVVIEFRFERPKSVKREFPAVVPDVDKLERAILDALTDARVFNDDAQVVVLKGSKVYAEAAGAFVQVGVIEGEGEQ